MLKSGLCDYRDAYILVSGTITVVGAGADVVAIAADRDNKQVLFKNCAPFTDCITEKNNTQVDKAKDSDVWLYQFRKNELNNIITESKSFKFKSKFLDNTNNEGIINSKIATIKTRI